MNARKLVETVTAASGFTRSAGVEVVLAEPGHAILRLLKKPELLQFNGHFHGGVVAGLADHAAGAATSTALQPGRIAVTIDLHVNYLAPAGSEAIVAEATAVTVGNTICVASVAVFNETSGPRVQCAMATVTLRVVDAPPAAELSSRGGN